MSLHKLSGSLPEPAKPTKNFIKENMKSVRKLQGNVQVRARDTQFTAKTKNQPQNRQGVPGQTKGPPKQTVSHHRSHESGLGVSRSPSPPNVKCAVNLDRGDGADVNVAGDASGTNLRGATPRPSTSSIAVNTDLSIDQSKGDYVFTLKQESEQDDASSASGKKGPGKTAVDRMKLPAGYQRGMVPKYLLNRREEWRLEKERQQQERYHQSICPPGHKIIPEEEQKATLATLQTAYNKLISELNCMPVCKDTIRIRQRKLEIEKELDRVEEGIRVFSRTRVVVADN